MSWREWLGKRQCAKGKHEYLRVADSTSWLFVRVYMGDTCVRCGARRRPHPRKKRP